MLERRVALTAVALASAMGCQVGADAKREAALGIELPATSGFPAVRAAVALRPDSADEAYVEPLAALLVGAFNRCSGRSAVPLLTSTLAIELEANDGRLRAARRAEETEGDHSLRACLLSALDGAELAALGTAPRTLTLELRASEAGR